MTQERIEEDLAEDRVDIGIAFAPPQLAGIEVHELHAENLEVVVGAGHPAAAGQDGLDPQQLAQLPLVLLSEDFATASTSIATSTRTRSRPGSRRRPTRSARSWNLCAPASSSPYCLTESPHSNTRCAPLLSPRPYRPGPPRCYAEPAHITAPPASPSPHSQPAAVAMAPVEHVQWRAPSPSRHSRWSAWVPGRAESLALGRGCG
jgi:hypothetical protein